MCSTARRFTNSALLVKPEPRYRLMCKVQSTQAALPCWKKSKKTQHMPLERSSSFFSCNNFHIRNTSESFSPRPLVVSGMDGGDLSSVEKELQDGLNSVAQRGNSLLQLSEHLAGVLPRTPLNMNEGQFPYLLAQYELLSNHAKDVRNAVSDIFQHYIISPKDTGHTEKGEPTTLLPDMLQTKKPPEQEKSERDIKEVTEALKERSKADAEVSHSAMLDQEDAINKSLMKAHAEFCDFERSLIANSKSMVEQYSSSRLKAKNAEAIALLKYVERGTVPKGFKQLSS